MNGERPAFEPQSSDTMVPAPKGNAAQIGAWKRLVLVFTNPTEVFTDIARKPTWVACLVLTTVLAMGASFAVIPHIDYEATIRNRMARSEHKISDQQMNRIMKNAGKFAYIQPVASVVVVPLIMLIIAAFYFLALKLAGSEATYLHTFSAFLHASWPAGFTKGVLTILLVQRFGKLPAQQLKNVVRSNVGAFLPAGAPHWLHTIGQTFDVFNAWTFVLLILGMSAVGHVSRRKAAVAVSALWILFIIVRVVFALVLHH
ncbi:MAG: YIP1 family protein [Acidobacteria bacterium]|nr:YIP1 family protein [Acidobacteriota bacterium]